VLGPRAADARFVERQGGVQQRLRPAVGQGEGAVGATVGQRDGGLPRLRRRDLVRP
jgi:hypothetical protein